jgi:hypothetical protein
MEKSLTFIALNVDVDYVVLMKTNVTYEHKFVFIRDDASTFCFFLFRTRKADKHFYGA